MRRHRLPAISPRLPLVLAVNGDGLRILGSAGCQPASLGSLPRLFLILNRYVYTSNVAGMLPATAGWQPALPERKQSDPEFCAGGIYD